MFYEDYYEDGHFEEDDILTNFTKDELPIYQEAINKYGDDSLFINDNAFDCYGNRLKDFYSLRETKVHEDLSCFWSIVKEIRKQ